MDIKEYEMNKGQLQLLADVSLAMGFLSIIISIVVFRTHKESQTDQSRAERTGIFIGLWVPSFFILSNRLARKATEND